VADLKGDGAISWMSIPLLVDFSSLSTFLKDEIHIGQRLVSGNGNKSAEQRRINIQNIRKRERFTILFVKIVELPRSPYYASSRVSLLRRDASRRGDVL